MRKELRAQLRRQKARPRSANPFWSQVSGINVPWTVGQRKWIQSKIKAALEEVFARVRQIEKPDLIVMSQDVYDEYRKAVVN